MTMKEQVERLLEDWPWDKTAELYMAKELMLKLLAEVSRLEQREAESHDLMTTLWAYADEPTIDRLAARVDAVLGADDPDGHCGNAICAEMSELREQIASLQAPNQETSK